MGSWSDLKKLAVGLLGGDEQAKEEINRRLSALQELFHSIGNELPPFASERTLTYEAAIRYFVQARPRDERVVKGALFREQHQEGKKITVIQVFLDSHNNLICMSHGRPYGRQVMVESLDRELEETLGNTNLIIVE